MELKIMAYRITSSWITPMYSDIKLCQQNNFIGYRSYANKAAMANAVRKSIDCDGSWSNMHRDIKSISTPIISKDEKTISFTIKFLETIDFSRISAFIVYDDSNGFKPLFVRVLDNGIIYGADTDITSVTITTKLSDNSILLDGGI